MSEVVGEAVVRVRTDESGVNFDKSGKDAGASYSKGFTSSLKGIAGAIGVTVAAKGAVDLLKGSLTEAREAQKVAATTEQIITSTGGAAQVSADQVGDLASALSLKAGIDDELIQSGANLILTFKNVQNAGEGVDAIFDRTNAAALDLSAAGFGSVQSASLQLGKALNDPIKGMSALARSGVTFTAAQKAQVAALVETGDLLSAQKIILEEVESQVGGVAEATVTAGDRATVAWGNLQETIGAGLLPVVDRLSVIFTSQVVPGVTTTVGVVGDLVNLFQALPPPVQTAAAAFVALKVAAASGLTDAVGGAAQAGLGRATGLWDGLSQRVGFARAAFDNARSSVFVFGTTSGQVSGQASRLSATLQGVRAAAFGAGAAAKGFLVAALPIAALTAGITLYAKFKQSQEEARQRVADLTASLDEQTGAITKNTEENVIKSLVESGALADAKSLGLDLGLVTQAALGSTDAIAQLTQILTDAAFVSTEFGDKGAELSEKQQAQADAAQRLTTAILGESDALGKAQSEAALAREAHDGLSDSTDDAAGSMTVYTSTIDDAKDALRTLIDVENERREDLISDRRDQIALNQALKDAREESRKGKGGFDLDTGEGQRNLTVLLDLADQFNSSTNEIRRTNFRSTRDEFIRLAVNMGKTISQAERLADELLRVPKNAPVRFQSEGYQELMRQIESVKAAISDVGGRLNLNWRAPGIPQLATGTRSFEGGVALVGEEGPELVRMPRGTQVNTAAETRGILGGQRGGITVRIDKLMPHNYSEFERQILEQDRAASIGGRPVPVG